MDYAIRGLFRPLSVYADPSILTVEISEKENIVPIITTAMELLFL
jgi:hypothetical protein